jgi:PAS domain S-box-containing protein
MKLPNWKLRAAQSEPVALATGVAENGCAAVTRVEFGPYDEIVTQDVNGFAATEGAAQWSERLRAREDALQRHNQALGTLARSKVWERQGLAAALREITETAARGLNVTRSSIWLFDAERTRLTCQDLYEIAGERHSAGAELSVRDFPLYFRALAADRTINAHNAHDDPRTREFSANYLRPLGIRSMLDAPIMIVGQNVGVLCNEQVGAPRVWSAEDEAFVGAIADFIGLAIKAEERQQAEIILRESEERYRAMAETASDAILTIDDANTITFVNAAAERIFGYSAAELIGQPIARLIPRADSAEWSNPAGWHGVELWGAHRSGGEIPLEVSIGEFVKGGRRHLTGIFRDITERKRAEEERAALLARERELRRAAEEANRLKDDFLATVSHELRTPLTAILGWTRMLAEDELDETMARRALQTIERSAQAQAALVGDLLDASRIATGKLKLESRPVQLISILEATVDAVRPVVESKALRLQMVLEPWVGPFNGDPERLQQIVWNLLTNSVKFTPPGGLIEVRLERLENKALLIVSDTGRGIEPEFLPHVFDRFRQSDGSSCRMQGGLGLGLAIVKHLVELHQGAIYAYSAGENKGSDFMITLPLATPSAGEGLWKSKPRTNTGEHAAAGLEGARVLVVDDEYDTREVLSVILNRYGAEIRTAASAEEALALLTAWRPDALVSDIGMPGEDGYSLIRRLRALPPEQGGETPAIALTAYAGMHDRQRALSTGFQMHIAKPIEPVGLARVVARLLERGESAIEK